jgi:hypothetical protein
MGAPAPLPHHSGMTIDATSPQFSLNGRPAESAPRCCGVYRFFGAEGALLYIGKSIDIHTRVRSHYADARKPGRQQRMMRLVSRIDCQPTAGEFSALLLENAAIKAESPLFNRRQRRARRLWTIALEPGENGFLKPVARDFAPDGARDEESFGLYHNRHHIESTLRRHARDNGLCLRVMGLDRGRGPCFQHQLKRCRGACAGQESPAGHNRRLQAVLDDERILAWPFAGPIALVETADRPREGQPQREWQLVHHWSFCGSFADARAARAAARAPGNALFDRDAYRILLNAMRSESVAVLDAASGEPVDRLFADARQAS